MYVATERGTSDNTEATRFSQCAHDQRRRLEAEDSVRQYPMCPINFRWEETYTPTTLPCSRSPHNVLHSPSYYGVSLKLSAMHGRYYKGNWASVSEPHTCDFNATFSLNNYISTYISATVTVLLKLRSIFRYFIWDLIRGARAIAPTRSGRPHPFLKPLPTGPSCELTCSLCSSGIVLQV